jgi:FAD synthetase
MKKKRVVVFGIFDGVHDGHRDFFRQAKKMGDELWAIVGRDAVAKQLKGRKPKYGENERVQLVQAEPFVTNALLGDKELSNYSVLVHCNPDIVCMGYDQQELEVDLRRWVHEQGKNIQVYRAKPYRETEFHNSLLT